MQMLYQSTKKDKSDKTNYWPESILPNISKIYEKIIYNQLYEYFYDKLSSSQCRFRKGCSSQHSLLVMTDLGEVKVKSVKVCASLVTQVLHREP